MPALVLVAVAVLAVALLTGHVLKFGPLSGDKHKAAQGISSVAPQLPLAAVTLDTYPGQDQRGVFQSINRVVASGNTIVTMGSQTSDGVVRQQFLVSTNAGASWRLAPVSAPGGGQGAQAALGHPATLLAGGAGGWVAVGPQAIWTSPTGQAWTLAVVPRDQPAAARRLGVGDHEDRRKASWRPGPITPVTPITPAAARCSGPRGTA